MGRLITESGTSLAIVAANNFEVTYFPFNVGAESITIDTRVDAGSITSNTLSANSIVGEWAGLPLQSYQVNVEGIDIKATGVPPNRYLKTNEQGIVAWVEESKSSLDDIDDLDINNNLTVKGYISAQGNLSANDIDAQSNILSAGVNLLDIFTAAGGAVAGSGTTNKVTKWTNSTTVGDSNISDNGDTVTIASSISSGNLLNITNDGDSKFCVAYDGSTTIQGNLSVHGDMHYIDTNVTVTSALSIINSGTGPALYVEQKGTEPIAHFIDKEGDDIIFDDNGRIGLGLFSPEQKLTVAGGISASESLSAHSLDLKGTAKVVGANSWAGLDNQTAAIYLPTDNRGIHGNFSTNYARNLIKANGNYIDIGDNGTSLLNGTRIYAGNASSSAGTITLHTNGAEQVRVNKTGNVGIGATVPGAKLTVQGNISGSGDLCLVDNGKIRLGDSSDLQIYHNGTHNFITAEGGSGSLYIRPGSGNTVQIEDKDGQDMITAGGAGAVNLFYNNSKKLETTNTGIDITGTITSDGHTIDGDLTVNGSISASDGLSANNLNSAYNIISAGTDLVDIFAPASGGGYIDGSGTANTIAKFSDSNTITDSCITDNGTIVTVSAPVSSDDYIKGSKFCLGANSRVDNPATNNLGLFANNDLGLEIVSDTRVCSHLDLTVNGTISASSNLSAGGRFFAPNGAQASPTFSFSDFPGTGLFMADTDTLGFSTKNCRRVVIDESGNVGIGEANPSYPLHICQSGAATLAIQSNGNDDEGSKLRLIEGSANWLGGYVQYDGADNNFILGVHNVNNQSLSDDNPVITIPRDSGNVGIGVTNPGVTLTVQGGISASGGLSAGNLEIIGGSGTTNFLPKFTDPDTLGDSIAYVGSDNINIEGGLSALQGLSADNNIYGGGCVNHFVNNVGINIANPNEKLTVQGAISSSNKGVFDRIGIGTNDPNQKLTVQGNISGSGDLCLVDNGKIRLGDSSDLEIYHNGNNSIIEDSGTGGLFLLADAATYIQTPTGESKAKFTKDSGVELYFDNSKKFETTNTGITVQGNISASEGLSAGKTSYFADKVGIGITNPGYALTIDNGDLLVCTNNGGYFQVDESANAVKHSDCVIAMFGTNNDLQIQHDSANSYISENGTGDLYITTNDASVYIQDANSGRIMLAAKGGSGEKVELNHSGSKKFETTSSGVNVTGDATINGSVSASDGLSANNLDSAFNILSAGTDLTDIFGPGGSAGNVDGSGTACFLPVWSDTDTIENSIACQSTSRLTINGGISSKGYCSDA